MQTSSWATTTTVGERIGNAFDLPWDMLAKDMYKRKVERFYGFRADIDIRVQVNAQPFQAGRLLLSWIPGEKYLGNKAQYYDPTVAGSKEKYLVPITGSPRIDLDLSTCTEATMCIPYISPYMFTDLSNGVGSIGSFQLIVYSPLVDTVSSGTVDVSMWMNFKNIKLRYPTGLPIAASAQVGTEAIQDAGGAGIISSAASMVSTALSSIQDVPLISHYAKPALWVSNAVRDVAKHFGWSKPTSVEAPHVTKLSTTRFMANADGIDTSHVMGISALNELETNSSIFRTDIDEMAISHVVKTPCYLTHFAWKSNVVAGKVLWAKPISPSLMQYSITANQTAPTHLAYIAKAFRMWRGGINLQFKFVKTKFHSGRVRIIYVPGDYSTSDSVLPTSDFDIDANYSAVVDLRSDTDVSFNVPYVAIQPWLLVDNTFPGLARTYEYSVGKVYVVVLNELRNASTVSDTVDVIVEASGASDFELSIPRLPSVYPSSTTLPPPPTTTTLRNILKGRAEVGTSEAVIASPEQFQAQGEVAPPLIGGQPRSTEFSSAAITVGEKVFSLRQVMKRFHRIFSDVNLTASNPSTGVYNIQSYKVHKPIAASLDPVDIDLYAYFSWIYSFYRGSFRFKIMPYDNSIFATRVRLLPETTITGGDNPVEYDGTTPDELLTAADIYMPRNLEGVFEFQVPHYSRYPILPNTGGVTPVTGINDLQQRNNITASLLTTSETMSAAIYRAVGDDFSFNQLIGPPFISRCTSTLT
nr:MAG: putative capsid protein [Cripavirus sp.]